MLIVITNGYPFGGEPFLQSEAPYLPEDTVFFAISADPHAKKGTEHRDAYRIGDGSATANSYFNAARALFDREIYKEIGILKKGRKLSTSSIRRLLSTYGSAWTHYKKITDILDKNYPGCVVEDFIVYSYWMDVHAVIAVLLKRKYGNVKTVSRCHGYDLYEYRHKTNYIPFRKLVFSSLDVIAPISDNGKHYLIETYGDHFAGKLKVFRLGTKDVGLNPVADNEMFTIVSCSSITKVKRLGLIVEALSCLKIPVKWVHFGDGDQGTAIKKLAVEKLDNSTIEYVFMGQTEKTEILQYYTNNHIDLFINTSESEGIPVSVMEAMSCGIPVVATDVGGTSEIVMDGINGKLVMKDAGPETIADALMTFVEMDENETSEYRKEARETWRKNYQDKVNFKRFAEMLESL